MSLFFIIIFTLLSPWERTESNQDWCRARVIYSHARSHAGLRSRKTKEPPRVSPGRLQSTSAFQPGLCVWSLPFVGHGLRLALGTHDDPLAGKVCLAFPGMPRAYVSRGALAPRDSGVCGCDQHGLALRRKKISATARSCQRSPLLRADPSRHVSALHVL